MTGRFGRGQRHVDAQVRTMLGEMADRLETNRPGGDLTEIGRLALIQATTMDPVLSRALRAAVPEVTGRQTVVRREFAARLREIAEATG
ncbi:hypothetical protein RM863_29305 [Streptomyces sp. DSM 41014]|uniref:Uncharacterized protein n=1 Tax=Streptomyces hintoniae TaxID=3075521 RepID=A0ABU2UT41_9ACTN|nr:hypothetical protein [Streptomyces sp. DSM 41014]MDT0476230.1 hypothetical protein [Streptomyces sp. DSM 41014]